MDNSTIIGNIFSFVLAVLIGISVVYKKKKDALKWQFAALCFATLTNTILRSYAAVATNFVGFFSLCLCYKDKLTLKKTIIICLAFIVIGCWANNRGVIGLFPVVAETALAVAMYLSKSAQHLRYGWIVNLPLWFFHDSYIRSYPAAVMDITLTIWTLVQIFRYKKVKEA